MGPPPSFSEFQPDKNKETMMAQKIDETFLGTSDPVSLEYSLSYYGPDGPDAGNTTIGESGTLVDKSVKIGWDKARVKLDWNWTAGVALPSWCASVTVKEGEISDDKMTLTLGENTVMGGMFFGVLIDFNLSLEASQWIPGHPGGSLLHPHWVSGHWDNLFNKSHDFSFDLIPMGLDMIWDLRTKIPAFKKLIALMPQGLLDHMQDHKNDSIQDEGGVFIDAQIPMKWDAIYLARQIAEVGVDVGSNVFTPAVSAAVTALTTVGEAMISLEEEAGVSLSVGPEINLVFPLHVKITELSADNTVFKTLSFDGDTLTGTDPDGELDVASTPVKTIGIRCKQTLELMEVSLGLWVTMSFAKIFCLLPKLKGNKDFNLVETLEEKLGFDIGLGSFNSSMVNGIGQPGQDPDSEWGHPPDSVKVTFV
jgi:hypothetical protein